MNYIEHSFILIDIITGCVFVSSFASLVGFHIGITSSAIGLKTCVTTAGIKKYKLTNKKNKEKNDKVILLAKSKLNRIEVLISKALTDSNISRDEFILTNDVLKEFYKSERKNQKF